MKRLFSIFENWIDPFRTEPEADLPRISPPSSVISLRQCRWPFFVFLLIGGLVGLIEASLFYFVGVLIDTLKNTDASTVWSDHGWLLAGMAATVLILRTLVLSCKHADQRTGPGAVVLRAGPMAEPSPCSAPELSFLPG